MSQASVAPAVIRAFYTIGQTLADVITSVGPGDTSTGAQKFLWIGVDDPDSGETPTSVEGAWTWPYSSATVRDEKFTLFCAAVATSGASSDAAQLTNVDNVYAIYQAFTQAIQADPSTGGVDLQVNGGSQKLTLASDDMGSAAYLFLSFDVQGRPAL